MPGCGSILVLTSVKVQDLSATVLHHLQTWGPSKVKAGSISLRTPFLALWSHRSVPECAASTATTQDLRGFQACYPPPWQGHQSPQRARDAYYDLPQVHSRTHWLNGSWRNPQNSNRHRVGPKYSFRETVGFPRQQGPRRWREANPATSPRRQTRPSMGKGGGGEGGCGQEQPSWREARHLSYPHLSPRTSNLIREPLCGNPVSQAGGARCTGCRHGPTKSPRQGPSSPTPKVEKAELSSYRVPAQSPTLCITIQRNAPSQHTRICGKQCGDRQSCNRTSLKPAHKTRVGTPDARVIDHTDDGIFRTRRTDRPAMDQHTHLRQINSHFYLSF